MYFLHFSLVYLIFYTYEQEPNCLCYASLNLSRRQKCVYINVYIFMYMYATCQWLLHEYHVQKEVFDLAGEYANG